MTAEPLVEPPGESPVTRARRVFAAYLLAFAGYLLLSLVAMEILVEVYQDVAPEDLLLSLPAILAGGLASATALMLALVTAVRPLEAERLRLRPGRETGRGLAAIVVGTLALGQMLDSAIALLGLARHGTMDVIRRALEGATGSDLFAAVLVIGPIAGSVEEIFFRGYMQTALARAWRPAVAVVVTAAAFALMHLDWVHTPLALAIGLWLGVATERTGSALPAVAAHVINNTVFALLTAAGGTIHGAVPNLVAGGVAAAVFAGCVVTLLRGGTTEPGPA